MVSHPLHKLMIRGKNMLNVTAPALPFAKDFPRELKIQLCRLHKSFPGNPSKSWYFFHLKLLNTSRCIAKTMHFKKAILINNLGQSKYKAKNPFAKKCSSGIHTFPSSNSHKSFGLWRFGTRSYKYFGLVCDANDAKHALLLDHCYTFGSKISITPFVSSCIHSKYYVSRKVKMIYNNLKRK